MNVNNNTESLLFFIINQLNPEIARYAVSAKIQPLRLIQVVPKMKRSALRKARSVPLFDARRNPCRASSLLI